MRRGPDRVAIRLLRARLRDSRSATQTGPREALMPWSDDGIRGCLERKSAAAGLRRRPRVAEQRRYPRRPARIASRSGCSDRAKPSCRGAAPASAASCPDRVAIRLLRARLHDSRSATQTGPGEALMPRSDAGICGVLPGSRRDPAAPGTTPRQPVCDADRTGRSPHAAERRRHPRLPARIASRSGCLGRDSATAGLRRRPDQAKPSGRGAMMASAAASGATPRQPVCDADRTEPRARAAEQRRHLWRPARIASRSGCSGHDSTTAGLRRRPDRATPSCREATAASAAARSGRLPAPR